VTWGRYRLEVSSPDGTTATTVFAFDSGFYAESSADTPDLLETRSTSPNTAPATPWWSRSPRGPPAS
jgi:alpha-2-macroglobulin